MGDQTLSLFNREMQKFNTAFCDNVNMKKDFTLKVEVRGDKGKLVHIKLTDEAFTRPTQGAG